MAVLGLRFCARAFSLVVASGGHSSSRRVGLSLSRPLLLQSTGSRRAGSAIVAHGPSCSTACGIPPRPGLEPVSPALAGRLPTTAPPGKPLVTHFIHSSVYMSIPISQFIPLPFSPWYPYVCSLCLCLYFCYADKFICIIFPDSTCK